MIKKISIFLMGLLLASYAIATNPYLKTTSGKGDKYPDDYVPPFLGNGSISSSIDYLGKQIQRKYVTFYPEIVWEGRRYPPTVRNCSLITMGHFDDEIFVDGNKLGKPLSWKQSLDTKNAVSISEVEYDLAKVTTFAFVPYGMDMFVVRKTIEPKSKDTKNAEIKFTYLLTDLNSGKAPERVLVSPKVDNSRKNAASLFYTAYAYKVYNGEISIISDTPSSVSVDDVSATLKTNFDLQKNKAQATYFISFADDYMLSKNVKSSVVRVDFDGIFSGEPTKNEDDCKSKEERSIRLKEIVAKKGFDGILADHKAKWADFWKGASINVPDDKMMETYLVALYHMNSMYTKWSIPVSLFGHSVGWSGRFFGWDEMFCAHGVASSGKFELSKRTAKFRKDTLRSAMNRVAHYGKIEDKKYGARYPWESLEDAAEGAPNPYGFWFDHVFHMSNIASSAWTHYLYTGDKNYLKEIAYPVIRECAAFYHSHMLQKDGDKFIIGKCTDIERLGPARENPFITSCGAIYNFEIAARAAEILGVDKDYADKLLVAAKELRKTLPRNDEMYLPFDGCKEKNVVAIGGFYPYNIFDKSEKKQVAAVYDVMKNLSFLGNMYPMGKAVCSWYAAWISTALVVAEDNVIPEQLLSATARNVGQFGETWEINEPNVRHTPWFTTSAGNYVYALNQVLVSPKENGDINVATSIPEKWKNFSYKLPVYGGGWVDVKSENGKLVKLDYTAGENDNTKRRIVIPQRLIPQDKVSPEWKKRDSNFVIEVEKSFKL